MICIHHLHGGTVNLKRKCFWQTFKKTTRDIKLIDDVMMSVDNVVVNIIEWLSTNEGLWFPEWNKWRKTVALCSRGDWHWSNGSPVVCYARETDTGCEYMGFNKWKIECYVKPSYDMIEDTDVFKFLSKILYEDKVSIGLVHPMVNQCKNRSSPLKPITKEYMVENFKSDKFMACQPYVVAAKLLGVDLNDIL